MDDGPYLMDPLAVNFVCQNIVNHGFFDIRNDFFAIRSPIDVKTGRCMGVLLKATKICPIGCVIQPLLLTDI